MIVVDARGHPYSADCGCAACRQDKAEAIRNLPGEIACPSEECPLCTGEACQKCGAGLWRNPAIDGVPCEHDVCARHEQPSVAT